MAGGWDADAIAGRMEEAIERAEEAARDRARQASAPPADRSLLEREESIRLSRVRIENQLAQATNPTHKAMLERALRALTDQSDRPGGESV